jgi:hypothetical protein
MGCNPTEESPDQGGLETEWGIRTQTAEASFESGSVKTPVDPIPGALSAGIGARST